MSDETITRTVNGVLFTRNRMRANRAVWTAEDGLACRVVEVQYGPPAIVAPTYRVVGEPPSAELADFRAVARKAIRRRRVEIMNMRAEVAIYHTAWFAKQKPKVGA